MVHRIMPNQKSDHSPDRPAVGGNRGGPQHDQAQATKEVSRYRYYVSDAASYGRIQDSIGRIGLRIPQQTSKIIVKSKSECGRAAHRSQSQLTHTWTVAKDDASTVVRLMCAQRIADRSIKRRHRGRNSIRQTVKCCRLPWQKPRPESRQILIR